MLALPSTAILATVPPSTLYLLLSPDPTGENGGVVTMERERFEELVADALDAVPAELLQRMSNVVVLVEDDSPQPGLLGLYEGYALTDRGWDYAGVLPDRITIYRNPTLAICETEADVVAEVAVTVVHEIAHHFGIPDARLHELGWG
jgi:predicted Zn-dependent protease with MMP-like domain